MITIPIQIRPGDHDTLGHVNNAAYVAYVQQAVAEFLAQQGFGADWRQGGSHRWVMRELAIEYRLATSFGDRMEAMVWLAQADDDLARFGCQLNQLEDGQPQAAVRTQSGWQRCRSSGDDGDRLPEALLATAQPDGGVLPRPFKPPAATEGVRRYQWRRSVERSDVGPGDRVHPQVLFQWIEEGILSASNEAGWPIERYLAENFIVLQMRHDAVFHGSPLLGESVTVSSRMINVRRLRGTWHNEVHSLADGRLLATNYSTGVFLNLDGRPTSPPPGLAEALQGARQST